jgi:hypothetical protein
MTYFPVTLPFSPVLKAVGTVLAGYGIADRVAKK